MQRGDRVGGRFEIVSKVASGGMGTVFRGREVRSRRDVAIKVVTVSGTNDAGRFAREAALLAGFHHPGVVGYVAHGNDYLVMEWVEGETLRQRLDRAPLAARETVTAARQLADALAALHAAGIVHRDVKPANLMIADDHLTLVDFGIARGALGPRLTLTGTQVGTAGYMAPEQARGERDITASADLFALGCVLYECLVGAPAFRGDSAMAMRAKVLLDDLPRLRALAPALPVALDELVARLLAREPAQRPTASEASAALAAIDVDAPAPPPRDEEAIATAISQDASGVCAVLIALADDGLAGPALGDTAARFAGGAVALRPHAAAAAALALDLAAQLPDATIAVAAGRSSSDAIDRTAWLMAQLEIAAAAGEPVAGAWVDPAVASGLGEFAVESHGSRLRLRGAA